jgi:polyisoprenoid-binding protein YceI
MSNKGKVLLGVAVVVVLVGAGLWWFLRDDAPEEVDLDRAVEQVEDEGDGEGGPGDEAEDSAIAGTWTIDAETGDFDFESATGTFAGFRIEEELAGLGSTEAVGRTGAVSGSFTIEGTTVTEADFEVDLSTLTTNESRRDSRVQDALETGEFPTATFTLTAPIELGPEAEAGEAVTATAVGDLTVHGVTQAIEMPVEAQLVDGAVVLVGSVELALSDFDVEAPTAPVVLSVSDRFTLELQFLLTR